MSQVKRGEKICFFSLLEDGDDDDDPEYNFLEDLDEPDREDYRTDRAVRITSECVCMCVCVCVCGGHDLHKTPLHVTIHIRSVPTPTDTVILQTG